MADLDGGPAVLISGEKITASHRARDAYVYVRQSTLLQARVHTESLARQYDLRQRAAGLGWPAHQVVVIDEDLGRSGATAAGRSGFSELVADVGLGKAGIILALEVSRLARSNADWYQLLDLCAPFVRLMLIVCVITGRRPGAYPPPDEPTAGNEASRGATRHPQ